jgi:hypothetical protein
MVQPARVTLNGHIDSVESLLLWSTLPSGFALSEEARQSALGTPAMIGAPLGPGKDEILLFAPGPDGAPVGPQITISLPDATMQIASESRRRLLLLDSSSHRPNTAVEDCVVAVVEPVPLLLPPPLRTGEPILDQQGHLLRTVLWLAAAGIAIDQREALHRLRTVAQLSKSSSGMDALLDPAVAAATATLDDSARTDLLRALDSVPERFVSRPCLVGLTEGRSVARLSDDFGPDRAVTAAVYLLAVLARAQVLRGAAGSDSASTLVASWFSTGTMGWRWTALAPSLDAFEDDVATSVLMAGDGFVGGLFWWLHALSETLTASAIAFGSKGALVRALREHEVLPGADAAAWLEIAHVLMAGSDQRVRWGFPTVCGIAGPCGSCRQAALLSGSSWSREVVARSAVWLVLVLADLAAAGFGLSAGDEQWQRERRAFLGRFTLMVRRLEEPWAAGPVPPSRAAA